MKSAIKLFFIWMVTGASIGGYNFHLNAQTTGKISGQVVDEKTLEPLPGANILIEGTQKGTAADGNGDFFILNLSPGNYTLRIQMMGYQPLIMKDVRVSINRTATIEAKMVMTTLEAEEVVVTASRATVKKDQTSSIRNVSAEQIDILPVENVADVIQMQSGVVAGHFRGGRLEEVSYLVDGLQVDESFLGKGKTVDLEPEAIQDLEVITGTFNAEYGRAMSGIVNAITKDGSNEFHAALTANLANYLTASKNVFIGLNNTEFDRNQDYKFQISGPIVKNRLTFLANYRYQNYKNHLNGIWRFNVDDFSSFISADTSQWLSSHRGNGSYVPLNDAVSSSFLAKLTSPVSKNLKLALTYSFNDDQWQWYNHYYKYNPYGLSSQYRKTHMFAVQLNHLLAPTAFYEGKISYLDNYSGNYRFKNPLDQGYVNDYYARYSGAGFATGGQQKNHIERTLADLNAKWDLTWQVNKNHSLKTGILYTRHDLQQDSVQIQNRYWATEWEYVKYEPVVYPDSSIYSDIYRIKPWELSVYIQDKIEYEEMVINFGLRYDYFNPNTTYPSQLRNPANQLKFYDQPDRMSSYPRASAKFQISPRLGLAYQLSDVALLHFSYGHFFQMPPMFALYENHSFQVPQSNYATTMGNSQIRAQKTVQYEIGLWQELMDGMGIEVALYYRDIYDLLSTTIITTYNQIRYGLYTNKDYGNAKGIELKYDFAFGNFSSYVNYALQYTRGNADNPRFNFDRAGNSRDPVPTLIPMSWDQRHTLNATVNYSTPNYGATLTGYYDSGTPYTWEPLPQYSQAFLNLYPNNVKMPGKISFDFTSYYLMNLARGLQLRLTLSVFNLLDRLNENAVYGRTGRAYTTISTEIERMSHRSDFNDYLDRIQNPAMYSEPRMIKLGLGVQF